jgi:hypothetical protein
MRLKPFGQRRWVILAHHTRSRSAERMFQCELIRLNRGLRFDYGINEMNQELLLTYTKLAEDHVEHILDVHPAQQPSQRIGGRAQLLGDQFLALPGHRDAPP